MARLVQSCGHFEVSIDQLFWEDAEPDGSTQPAVSREVFERCTLRIMSEAEFASNERTLQDIARSIPQKGFADVEWHHTRWTEKHLVNECGFIRADGPTMLAVAVGDATGDATGDRQAARYALKYVYLPLDQESPDMRALCAYMFDEEGGVRPRDLDGAGLRGQSLVVRRGNKAMNRGSTMAMFGSWDCWDCHGLGPDGKPVKVKGVTQPRVYNPNGAIDGELISLLRRHADDLNTQERKILVRLACDNQQRGFVFYFVTPVFRFDRSVNGTSHASGTGL